MPSIPPFEAASVSADVATLHRLQVVPQAGATLSAAARAYNLQLARVDKLKAQLAEMETLSLAHRHALTQQVYPLTTRHQALMKQMALWLDAQLTDPADDAPKLTPHQRQAAKQIVTSLAAQLAQGGDADMVAVHDRHSPQTLADMARAHAQGMKAQLEAMMGEAFMPDDPDATLDDVMQAAKARMQEAVAEEEAAREATAAKRKAKKAAKADAKAPNAAQALQAALQGDADTSLRTLYRQLAEALAPHARLRHIKVEDGPGHALGRSFRVKLWPTLVLLRDGQEIARVVRPTQAADLSAVLSNAT